MPSAPRRIDTWTRSSNGRSDQVRRILSSAIAATSTTLAATGPSRSGRPDVASARVSLSSQTTTADETPGQLRRWSCTTPSLASSGGSDGSAGGDGRGSAGTDGAGAEGAGADGFKVAGGETGGRELGGEPAGPVLPRAP